MAPARKFNKSVRNRFIQSLRDGNLKYESARICGISYRTVHRFAQDNDEFANEIVHAMAEAREGIEKVLFGMAEQGDLGAIKMWLVAHARSTYADKLTVEIDATDAAVSVSANEALAQVARLQSTLAERRVRLEATGDLPAIEAKATEVPTALPIEAPSTDETFTI